jgi:hypothetical protein
VIAGRHAVPGGRRDRVERRAGRVVRAAIGSTLPVDVVEDAVAPDLFAWRAKRARRR